ncbi:MAG TPA: RteC domain-containing protein [Hanamia sp.]|nr:RteC domain-containing protein [Hanamia sp.]
MSLHEFTSALYDKMDKMLAEINSTEINVIERLKASSLAILQVMSTLKDYIINYKFTSQVDEINFFKNIKPRFLSQLFYFRKAFEMQSNLPLGSIEDEKNFCLKELKKINEYQIENKEFLSYYRANSTFFDEVYFIRKEPDSWMLLNFDSSEIDLRFTTFYDLKISKILAFESLTQFIKSVINKLEAVDGYGREYNSTTPKIKWTASKVSLIELLYALQSSGSFNNGSIDLKNLASSFEKIFDIDLGNFYRVFQEIRIRKQSRTTFLDQLKIKLIKRMDDSDENPKKY